MHCLSAGRAKQRELPLGRSFVVAQDVSGAITCLNLEIAIVLGDPAIAYLDNRDMLRTECKTARLDIAMWIDTAFNLKDHWNSPAYSMYRQARAPDVLNPHMWKPLHACAGSNPACISSRRCLLR
jgi:hypothetical protein